MIHWYQEKLTHHFDVAAKSMVVLSAFAIPMGTAVMSISTALLFLFWLLGGNFRQKFIHITKNKIALWASALFVLLAIGVSYSSAEWNAALDTLSSYKKLLFIPIIISLMLSEKWCRYAIYALIISMTIVLAMSYLKYFQVLPYGPPGQEYTVFKGRIAHGIFMAFFFYLLAQFAIQSPRWRWLFMIVALLTCLNLLFLNTGRSGYIVFASLVFLLFFQYFNWRGLVIAVLVLTSIVVLAFFFSDNFHDRITESVQDVQQHVPGDYQHNSGLRYRLEYYATTIKVIKKSLLYGHGTGSLATEYKKIADQEGLSLTDNPHNEYMLITAQLGLVGLAVFLGMLFVQWRASYQLEKEYRLIIQGVLITIISGCLLNSLLLDAGEGKFYVILTAIIFSLPAGQHKTITNA